MNECFIHGKSILRKIRYVPLRNLRSIICQVVAYERLKTKENFRLLVLKVVAVAYERWSLTRGSKYSDLS